MGTSQKRAMCISSIAKKAEGYGMASEFVDGMDVMAVREATLASDRTRPRRIAHRRFLKSALIALWDIRCAIRANTARRDEIKKYQERDPIVLFKDSV